MYFIKFILLPLNLMLIITVKHYTTYKITILLYQFGETVYYYKIKFLHDVIN